MFRRVGTSVMHWTQVYDPLGHWWLSTLIATLPILVLFGLLAGLKLKPHWCAIAGASTAVAVAVVFFKMPWILAAMSFGYGVAFGLLKIAWIVLAAGFLGCILLRRFYRRSGGVWRPSCDRWRFHDRTGLQAVSRSCLESDCQYR